jgi:hypothetical protein
MILLPIREDANGLFCLVSYQVGTLRFRGLASHGAAISIIVAMYYLVSSETTITMDP